MVFQALGRGPMTVRLSHGIREGGVWLWQGYIRANDSEARVRIVVAVRVGVRGSSC